MLKDPYILDRPAFERPSKMDLACPSLANETIGLITSPIGFPISNKLPEELELIGQLRMWPGS